MLLVGIAAALVLAGLVYDPRAEAAEPKRVFGLVIASVAFAGWIARPSGQKPIGLGARAAIGFVALSAVSFAWGLPCGARDLGTWLAALGAGAIVARVGPRLGKHLVRLTAVGLGGGASFVALVCASAGLSGMSLHAGQGNPNWLGLLLAVTLPLSIDALFAWKATPRLMRILVKLVILAHLPALYVSHSRVGWVAAAIACAVQAAIVVRGRGVRHALMTTMAFAVIFGAQTVSADAEAPADLALRGRAWIWRETAHATARALPFGAGLGRFGHAFLDAQGDDLARMTPGEAARRFVNATTAHQEYLQVAVESGPVAALLLVCALLMGARDHARSRWYGGAGALVACAVASLGDSPIRQPAVALLVGAALGVPLWGPTSRVRRIVPGVVGLAAVTWLLYGTTRGWLSTRARTATADADPAARIAMLAKSVRLDPGSGEATLALGLARLAIGENHGALEALTRAETLMANTGTHIAIGSAFLAEGNATEAERAYRSAIAWSSGSFRARIGLGEALLAKHELEAAEREATIARKLMPGDRRGRELADRIREARMDE